MTARCSSRVTASQRPRAAPCRGGRRSRRAVSGRSVSKRRLSWTVVPLEPHHPRGQPGEHAVPARRLREWRRGAPQVQSAEPHLTAVLRRSVEDIGALRIFDPEHPGRAVVAAGAPWFMALFGRDSLLTSWMLLPWDDSLALGTLQTLADRQGRVTDPASEEEPGRILHEVRFGPAASLALGGRSAYYGTPTPSPPVRHGARRAAPLGPPRRGRRQAAAARRPRPGLDRALRGCGRRRVHRVRAQDRRGPSQPGLEGLLGRHQLRRTGGPPNRPSPWPKCRDTATPRTGPAPPSPGKHATRPAPATGPGRPPSSSAPSTRRSGCPAGAGSPSRSTATSGRSTRSPPTSGTACGPASPMPVRQPRSRTGCCLTTCSAAGESAPSPRRCPPTTR